MQNSKLGLMEEYKLLRDEIMSRQEARQRTLGLTATAVAAMVGFALGGPLPEAERPNIFAFALVGFALLVLVAALLLTLHHTQQIDIISAYIRHFIEPEASGIRWESRWRLYRDLSCDRPSYGGLPLGTSKPLAFFYAFMTLATYSVSFASGLHLYGYAVTVLSGLTLISLTLSSDLYFRKSRGWNVRWDLVDQAGKEGHLTPTPEKLNYSHVVDQ